MTEQQGLTKKMSNEQLMELAILRLNEYLKYKRRRKSTKPKHVSGGYNK